MRHEMSDVQRFLNQNKELHNTAQTMELFTDKFLMVAESSLPVESMFHTESCSMHPSA